MQLLNILETPPQLKELNDRYGDKFEKNVNKFLKAVVKDGTGLTNTVLSCSFNQVYRPGRNPAKDADHIRNWAKNSKYNNKVVASEDVQLNDGANSVIKELLYVGIIDRDYYEKGEKCFSYIIPNILVLTYIVKMQENEAIENFDIHTTPYVDDSAKPVVETFSSDLGVHVEASPLLNKVASLLQWAQVPTLDKVNQLNIDSRAYVDTNFDSVYKKDGAFYLKNSFKLSRTGRLFITNSSHRSGVTMKSEDKENFYSVLLGKDGFHNYDIQASQLNILPQVASMVGITAEECNQPIQDVKDVLEDAINEVGVDKGTIKHCLYSIIFASSSKFTKQSSSYNYIKQYFIDNGASKEVAETKAEEALAVLGMKFSRFLSLVSNIKTKLDLKLQVEDPTHIDNGVTKVSYPEFQQALKGKNRKGKTLAFYLQGLESKFIYTLIELCHKSGINILSYEFDGVISAQSITPEMFTKASEISGVKDLNVLEKEF